MGDDAQQSDLTRAMLDAAALFEFLGIRFALIGGLAAMYYGRSRFTEDADFIAASGFEKMLEANPDKMRRHHFDASCTWKLYHDSGLEIDIWKDRFVDDMLTRALPVTLAGRSIPMVEVHDLIAMKLRADRPQDDYDVSEIIKRIQVDDDRIKAMVNTEQFEHYQRIQRRIRR